MRTKIVDREKLSGNVEYTDGFLVGQKHSGLADLYVAHLANIDEFRHGFGNATNSKDLEMLRGAQIYLRSAFSVPNSLS